MSSRTGFPSVSLRSEPSIGWPFWSRRRGGGVRPSSFRSFACSTRSPSCFMRSLAASLEPAASTSLLWSATISFWTFSPSSGFCGRAVILEATILSARASLRRSGWLAARSSARTAALTTVSRDVSASPRASFIRTSSSWACASSGLLWRCFSQSSIALPSLSGGASSLKRSRIRPSLSWNAAEASGPSSWARAGAPSAMMMMVARRRVRETKRSLRGSEPFARRAATRGPILPGASGQGVA